MELPAALRQAVDAALDATDLQTLKRDADVLSRRYRAELRDGRMHLDDLGAVAAYLATRLPATYAAIRASLSAIVSAQPDFEPASLLDIGAGSGSALWAAADCWPTLARATLIEGSDAARRIGERLAEHLPAAQTTWMAADITKSLADVAPADLVTIAYVLDELAPADREPLIARLWPLAREMLLIVEPGTPAGWRRILLARKQLVEAGAHLIAPCPHVEACPISAPDWCHFARRVARSRIHRLAKQGEVPWEDEKFIFIAASRSPGVAPQARVLAPPRRASGRIELKLCLADGAVANRLVTRRDGEDFKKARRAEWGDAF